LKERWERVGELFDRLANAPSEERDSILAQSPDPDDVKEEARSLLEAHDRADGFLDASPPHAAPPAELPTGARIGPYRINRVAGRGGMGVVYDAEDTRLHRRVALKALPAAFDADESARLRLRQEARAAAALQHPGIATIYALEEIDGGLFISSEYLEGETLRDEFDRGRQPPTRALSAAVEIARALCTAHERGIVHRDLKPENIVRTTDGALKILDFGLAQFDEAASDLMSRTRITQQGFVVGTPAYMAPEQLLGRPTDFRVDHFALGIILYELCVGAHPFGGGSLPSTIARILAGTPHPPASLEQLPGPVWVVIERCLQKEPALRHSSTRELVSALEEAQRHMSQRTEAPQPLTPGAAPVALAALAAPVAAVAPALRWWRFHQLTAALAYWAAVWPVWHIHRLLGRAGLFFFLATVAAVVVAGNLRLHLWFSSRVYPEDLPAQRADLSRWIRWADLAFAVLLIGGGIALPEEHVGWAAFLIAYGIGSAIASVFIEPATARAAFRDGSS
jgi:eukaryotic-like serine/threonine-protein kinase